MDQMIPGDGGRNPLEAWFWEMPICTRWWTTATVLTSALVQCQMVTPFQLFYSVRTVFQKGELSFLGLLVFTAPYLPWVLMGFSLVMHGTVPKDEIMGVVIGHIWYFFSDVYPPMHNGSRPLDPPMWWRRLFEGRQQRDETADAINNEFAVAGGPELAAADLR
ncbi:hypothetical protein Daesc_005517 [Daldinia eschscholtzii]|uniref:Derlin n=1 Tax=Daldinia eschscholtzii TaxID=292717 RepID=A0AAX6MLD8_9PEZI